MSDDNELPKLDQYKSADKQYHGVVSDRRGSQTVFGQQQEVKKELSFGNYARKSSIKQKNADFGQLYSKNQPKPGIQQMLQSKSVKTLPTLTQIAQTDQIVDQRQRDKINKYVWESQKIQEIQMGPKEQEQRMRISESVKNILDREKRRDEKLQKRIKQINEKQQYRLKQITKKQDSKLNRIHELSTNDNLNPGTEVTEDQKISQTFQQENKEMFFQSNPASETSKSKLFGLQRHINPQAAKADSIIFNQTVSDRRGNDSILKNKSPHNNEHTKTFSKLVPQDGLNMKQFNLAASPKANMHQTQKDQSTNGSVLFPFQQNKTTRKDTGREDVSFLQDKAQKMYAMQTDRKLHVDPVTSMLMSQSQITTGKQATDDFLRVSLGMKQIGKSILDLPKNIDDLKFIAKEYMRNLGTHDMHIEEQIYLGYVEDQLKHQENKVKRDVRGQNVDRVVSPIRNLQEFFQKMLLKISQNDPQIIHRFGKVQVKPVETQIKSYVDVDNFTPGEFDKIAENPPIISTTRKNMKMINKQIMELFGEQAFGFTENEVSEVKAETHRETRRQSVENSLAEEIRQFSDLYKSSASKKKEPNVTSMQQKSKMSPRKASQVNKDERRKFIKSLAEFGESLTKPTIGEQKKGSAWVQSLMKDEELRAQYLNQDLGKPSSRKDALLLAQWFQSMHQVVEKEFQQSQQTAASKTARAFSTLKTFDKELQQSDSLLLIQVIHNVAIKEITRQVSVQCIERGIFLKSVFDSYARLIDLIFDSNHHVRKKLAEDFAKVTERHYQLHDEALGQKNQIISDKDKQIGELQAELNLYKDRELGYVTTNKRLTKKVYRQQGEISHNERLISALRKQIAYMEKKMTNLCEIAEYEKSKKLFSQIQNNQRKLEEQVLADHNLEMVTSTFKGDMLKTVKELQSLQGDIIKEADKATDMRGFIHYQEVLLGEPLTKDQCVITDNDVIDEANSAINLWECGLLRNRGTWIDKDWRDGTRTRPLRKRPKSGPDEARYRQLEKLYDEGNESFDTSSHNTIDYIIHHDQFSRSFTYGEGRKYEHLKRQRLIKRSISANNFNWNVLVRKQIMNEANRANMFYNSGSPLNKLKWILGDDLFQTIELQCPKLFNQLIDHLSSVKNISIEFCQKLLQQYNFSLQDHQINRIKVITRDLRLGKDVNVNEIKNGNFGEEVDSQNDNRPYSSINLTQRPIKEKAMFQFVEWNFQKRQKTKKKAEINKNHPCFPLVEQVLSKIKQDKPIKDIMPLKTAIRYLLGIYQSKMQQMNFHSNRKIEQSKKPSVSPDKPDPALASMSVVSKQKEFSSLEEQDDHVDRQINLKVMSKLSNTSISVKSKPVKDKSPNEENDKMVNSTSGCFIEWVYDFFKNKYGLKNAADKKFKQLLGSVYKYKTVNQRIYLFGRFLQLYEELSESDMKLYFEMVQSLYKSVLNFVISEDDENVFVPLPRALEYFKFIFSHRLTQSSLANCLKVIKNKATTLKREVLMKNLYLQAFTEGVLIDDFGEFIIHTTNQLQYEKLQNIEDLFNSADLNKYGVILYSDLLTLYKIIGPTTSDPLNETRKLFEEYSEIFSDIKGHEGYNIKAIGIKGFEKMCVEKDVFTIRQQNNFINQASATFLNVTDTQEAFVLEFDQIRMNIDNIYHSLTDAINTKIPTNKISDKERMRFQDMINKMVEAVLNPKNKKIAFFTFKLVEETIKRAILNIQMDQLMPVSTESFTLLKRTMAESQEHGKAWKTLPKVLISTSSPENLTLPVNTIFHDDVSPRNRKFIHTPQGSISHMFEHDNNSNQSESKSGSIGVERKQSADLSDKMYENTKYFKHSQL